MQPDTVLLIKIKTRDTSLLSTVGDMFDKDKAEKSHYHYRYVCCIRSGSTNNSSSNEKTRWQYS